MPLLSHSSIPPKAKGYPLRAKATSILVDVQQTGICQDSPIEHSTFKWLSLDQSRLGCGKVAGKKQSADQIDTLIKAGELGANVVSKAFAWVFEPQKPLTVSDQAMCRNTARR